MIFHSQATKAQCCVLEYMQLDQASARLFVDPTGESWLVVDKLLLLEPQGDLVVGRLNRVGTVTHVSTHVNGKVASDGTWGRGQWVGGTKDDSTLLDNVLTLPDSSEDWAGKHVGQQGWEEWLLLEVGVVSSQVSLSWGDKLDGNELVASVLEAAKDGGDKTTLDSVWLDGNECSLVVGHCWRSLRLGEGEREAKVEEKLFNVFFFSLCDGPGISFWAISLVKCPAWSAVLDSVDTVVFIG